MQIQAVLHKNKTSKNKPVILSHCIFVLTKFTASCHPVNIHECPDEDESVHATTSTLGYIVYSAASISWEILH